MSSRRSSTSHDSAGPSKRQKVYRACLACVNSKTRCEDVLPRDGCLRCRSKSKNCSLVQAEDQRPASQSRGPDEEEGRRLAAMEHGWNLLHQRIDRLEQGMYTRPTLPASTSASNIVTPSATAATRPIEIHELFSTLHWHHIAITERIFTVASDVGYPNPLSKGLVTPDSMELAFHLLKHRFSGLIALPQFLISSTPTPTHPFVMLAVLAHVAPTSDVWALIEDAILTVTSGAVGPDVPLALFIISLAPSPTDTSRAPMTALRIMALAYSVGQMMGWDAMSEVWHQSEWLTLPQWSTRFDQVLLWEAVKNRYNILCLMQGMSATLALSLAEALPASAPDRYAQSIAYIQSEARLIAVYAPILPRLCLAEIESQTSAMDVIPLLDSWPPLMLRLDQWRSQENAPSKLCKYESHAMQFSLAFRLSCVVQRIPSPVALESRIASQSFTGVNLLRYSICLLEIFNDLAESDLHTLPAYLHHQTVVSISVQQRSISYMRKQGGDWHQGMVPTVEKAAGRIRSLVGGIPARMLEMADEPKVDHGAIPDIDFEALFGVLPEDWMRAFNLENAWGPGLLAGDIAPL